MSSSISSSYFFSCFRHSCCSKPQSDPQPRRRKRTFWDKRLTMGTGASKLTREDLRFLEENTNFKCNEIRQWYKGFMRDCPDGHLSQDRFKDVYAQFFPGGDPKEFCAHIFRSFDKNRNGTIEFREFLLAINITSNKADPKDKLNWAFDMYDIDGDGSIDQDEMELIIKAIYNMLGYTLSAHAMDTPKERTLKIFSQMDTNHDGVLSKEEFTQGCINDQCLYQMLTADTQASRSGAEEPWILTD